MATAGTRTRGRRPTFEKARGIELRYAAKLRRIARIIGELVNAHPDPVNDPSAAHLIGLSLEQFADTLTPWAKATAQRVVAEVDNADAAAWNAHSRDLSRALRREIATAPTGEMQRFMMAEQVELIRSLPLEAAQRVHKLTQEGLLQGTRAKEIAAMIAASGQVTASRAKLIARTEVARTGSLLTQARAMHIGCTEYIWRTVRDESVRASHRRMEGKVVQWDKPPTLSDGTTTHAGQIYNCRCYAEPILPRF